MHGQEGTFSLCSFLYVDALARSGRLDDFLAGRAHSGYFSEPLTRTSALYFSVTVFSTVGFGDITAKTDAARLVVTAQMLLDLLLLGFGARVFLSAVKLGRHRHTPDQPQ